MATDPNLGFLDAILYLKRGQENNDLVEVFVLELKVWLLSIIGRWLS
jgi:hypothetical protein